MRDNTIPVSRRGFLKTTSLVGFGTFAGCVIKSDVGNGNSGNDGSNGNGENTDTGNGGNTDNGTNLSGNIRISGSSTVYLVSVAASEEFRAIHPDIGFDITKDGSTGGFDKFFLDGNSDINGSSRPILQEEVTRARNTGFEPIEIQVAGDALTAVVNNQADWIDCITMEQLQQIWHPDMENDLWSDIDPDWPDEPFDLYGAATTSGTFDYWTQEVVGELRTIRDDFEGTEEDDQIALGVAGYRYAHGYLPFAYYDNTPDEVKALDIDAGDGCTPPSLEAASDGSYPLARPIYWYINSEKLKQKPVLQEFVKFGIHITGDAEIIAEDIGYVPMNEQQIQAHLDKIDAVINE